jgi:predicted regulator of Ras-like GTPase activity (Roadblock/LC7/MglB family)
VAVPGSPMMLGADELDYVMHEFTRMRVLGSNIERDTMLIVLADMHARLSDRSPGWDQRRADQRRVFDMTAIIVADTKAANELKSIRVEMNRSHQERVKKAAATAATKKTAAAAAAAAAVVECKERHRH